MLGGNHELGYKIYENLRQKYPLNLLYPVLAAQYAFLPQGKTSDWNKLKSELIKSFDEVKKVWEQAEYLQDVASHSFLSKASYNLFNITAQKRFEALIIKEKELLIKDI
jgi:hypothetical protein